MTVPPAAQLAPVLRNLRLTGMLETLDARLAEARAGTLGHVEFLQVLCEDELAGRDATAVSRRLRAARLPSAATLENFDFSFNPKLPAAQIRDLARLGFVAAGEGLIIYGPVGVGKSHLAVSLAHQACRRGYDALFVTCSRLLAELGGGHADRSFTARLKRLAKPAVLVVDDFGMREFPLPRQTIFMSSSAKGSARRAGPCCSRPTGPRLTGTRCSPTRWWASPS